MLRAVSVVVLALVAALGVAATRAGAASQPLVVDMTEAGSHVRNLATYDTATPVAVRVIAPTATAAAVLAVDPLGGNQRFQLQRAADGAWTGPVPLATAGTWTLSVATIGPHGHATTTPSFAVRAEREAIALSPEELVALSCIFVAGGIGMIGVGRRVSRASAAAPETSLNAA
ncbi:MAG TPA: hypothetical protein VFB22_13345 [Candidatus Baltobacteraceae bacterium]|nr:hypothetical protein [Candidatus Baltobacteraceae bacterium]